MFLVVTAWFNRFSADDFYFISELKTKSFSELYRHLYFNWHGRWTSNLIQVLSFQFSDFPKSLFIFNLISFAILFLSFWSFLKTILVKFKTRLSKSMQLVFSGVFMMIFFFCCVEPSSTWFWHTSTVVYLWSIAAFLFAFSIFLKENISILNYLLLAISCIYLGGSNEPLAIITIISLGFSFYKKKEKKFILGTILIFLSLSIDFMSSGTQHRDEITPGLSFINLILYAGYGSAKFLFFDFYKTFLPAILLSVPFYWLGNQTKNPKPFQLKKELLFSVFIIVLAIIINQFLVIYPLGGLAPHRATTASSILISIILVRFFFLLGNSGFQMNITPFLYLQLKGLFIFFLLTFFYHYQYSKAYDERMKQIVNSNEEIIKVKPLPFSGYIYSAEITTDSSHFLNQHLKNGLGLKQEIVLEN